MRLDEVPREFPLLRTREQLVKAVISVD